MQEATHMTDMKWYVIHTYSGHENKVKTNLEKAIHSAALEDHHLDRALDVFAKL